jgi:hypothetical protein
VPIVGTLVTLLLVALVSVFFASRQGACCTTDKIDAIQALTNGSKTKPATVKAESYAARGNYATAARLQLLTLAGAFVVGSIVMARGMTRRKRFLRCAAPAFTLASALGLALSLISPQMTPTLTRLIELTVETDCKNTLSVNLLLDRLTFVAAALFTTSAAVLLVRPHGVLRIRLRELAMQRHLLNTLLAMGTVTMAASIFRMSALGAWIESYATSTEVRAGLHAMTSTTVQSWGVYYSMFLAAAHVPSAALLKQRIKRAARATQFAVQPDWFEPDWVKESWLVEIGRVSAILTPFIAGHAADILTHGLK